MQNEIYIGKPYLKKNGEYIRLCSDLKRPAGSFTFWFEVQNKYEKYLCTEQIDAFVLALLEYAMYFGCDLRSDTPMSEDLHYQLTNYGPKIIAKNRRHREEIQLHMPFTSERINNVGAVGTGFSAGVDSFYAVLKHLNPTEKSHKLTHLLIANNGAYTYECNAISEKYFYEQVKLLLPAAKELGLPLIIVNTNTGDLMAHIHVADKGALHIFGGSPIKLAGVVYALRKLFSIYYIASSLTLDEFSFDKVDTYSELLYYVKLVTTPSLSFYSSGTEAKRLEKLSYICKNKVVQKYLTVAEDRKNPRHVKNMRTMFELYSLDMLDDFYESLPIDDFKINLTNRLALYLSYKEERKTGFMKETIDMCKKNSIRIPKMAYIKSFLVYRPILFMKKIFQGNDFIRKNIYYRFYLDVLLVGKKSRGRDMIKHENK